MWTELKSMSNITPFFPISLYYYYSLLWNVRLLNLAERSCLLDWDRLKSRFPLSALPPERSTFVVSGVTPTGKSHTIVVLIGLCCCPFALFSKFCKLFCKLSYAAIQLLWLWLPLDRWMSAALLLIPSHLNRLWMHMKLHELEQVVPSRSWSIAKHSSSCVPTIATAAAARRTYEPEWFNFPPIQKQFNQCNLMEQ